MIELLSAPEEIREEVTTRIESGEEVTEKYPRLSERRAREFMQLSKEMPELLNSDARPNLNYAQAIALMSAPDELKAEIVERIENGEEISKAYEIEQSLNSPIGETVIPESNLRPLSKVEPNDRQDVWNDASGYLSA